MAAQEPDVRFVFMGDGNQRATLQRATAGLPNVEILPPVEDEMYLRTLMAADCLLVHERATVRDMSLPSKLTSYFATGLPVIGVVASTGGTAACWGGGGALVNLSHGDVASHFLKAIRALKRDPVEASAMGRRGRAYQGRFECPKRTVLN